MDYKSYLEDIFTDYTISDEVKFNYNGTDTHILIKSRGGGLNWPTSQYIPIQLLAYTLDPDGVKETLDAFAQTYSGTSFYQELEYVRQSYETAVVLSSGQGGGPNHYSMVSVLGALFISTNTSDIKTIKIDGNEIFTVQRKLSYTSTPNSQADSTLDDNIRLNKTNLTSALLQLNITCENKNNYLSNQCSALRQGLIQTDKEYTVTLEFSDNNKIETYTMKIDSHTLTSANNSNPNLAVNFTR